MIGWRQNIWGFCERKISSRLITRASHSFSGQAFQRPVMQMTPGGLRNMGAGNIFMTSKQICGARGSNSGGQVASGPRDVFASQGDIVTVSATWVMGSFMTRTSVTVPNCPKYSRSLSWLVCQLRPPTNSFPGAESELGVLRPLDSPCKMEPLIK